MEQLPNGGLSKWNNFHMEQFHLEQFPNGTISKWNNFQLEQFPNGTMSKWNNFQMELSILDQCVWFGDR